MDLGCPDITLAHDLTSGFAALERGSPDLAILDVRVRDDLIYPLAEVLARRKVPFIFCTGTHHTALPARWSTHPLIAKPVPKERLARALGNALQPALLQH